MAHEEGSINLLPISTLHAFPENYFIENIAVRRSGELLLTVHNREELLYLDPRSTNPPCLLHKFSEGVCGIVEVEHDVFYISSGTIGTKGSWAIFRVDLTAFSLSESGELQTPPGVKRLVDVPDALFLNGSTLVNASAGIILAADSLVSSIFRINVKLAHVDTWLHDPALAKTTDNPMIPAINGLKCHNGFVYISNTDAKTFLRVRVDSSTSDAAGSIETVASNLTVDDFAFDESGNAYLTTHLFQSVVRLAADGKRERIAGGPEDEMVAGTTAAAFGRTDRDQGTLYVTTTGGMSLPVHGKIGPGRVLQIEIG